MAVSLPHRIELRALLERLADGNTHAREQLERELGAARGDLEKSIDELREEGIDVLAAAGGGYRLSAPVELLSAERILAAMGEPLRCKLHRLDVLFEVDSTNTRLLALEPPPRGLANVCLSEIQRAGRGRRGRSWASPFGASIALSLGWSPADTAPIDPSLSLAVGVAIARATQRLGAPGIRLKWPNDIWLDDRKMGGVLVELRTEPGAASRLVVGIGINVAPSAVQRRSIEAHGLRIAALADACGAPVSRNALASALVGELLSMLGEFERSGFAAFRDEWQGLDALCGRPARVLGGEGAIEGTARGVDADGALLLEAGDRLLRFASGEVSLRLNEGDV